jgi:exopolysaccharide biosynthesis protein
MKCITRLYRHQWEDFTLRAIIKSILIILLIVGLMFLVTSPAIAQVVTLPLEGVGFVPQPDGYLSNLQYRDESIHVTIKKVKRSRVECLIARIRIADASQIRTAMSDNRYDKAVYVKALAMAKAANAVIALPGAFLKYTNFGYLIRQGELYRQRPDGKHDILMIDSNGNFHTIPEGTEEDVEAFLSTLDADTSIINSFNFGPILVQNGEALPMRMRFYQYRYKMQRLAIAQIGELEYAIIHCNGKSDASAGMTMADFGAFILEMLPETIVAYNLDGGGSAHVIFNGKAQHKTPDARTICDIIYFASAFLPDGQE